jgi:hypothetical protein
MSVDELQHGTQLAWKHAYSYRSMFRRLRHSPSPVPVAVGSNLAYRFYGRRLHRFYTCDWPEAREPQLRASAAL